MQLQITECFGAKARIIAHRVDQLIQMVGAGLMQVVQINLLQYHRRVDYEQLSTLVYLPIEVSTQSAFMYYLDLISTLALVNYGFKP